eukprot:1275830-Pyramimonas_sp.AAC.1
MLATTRRSPRGSSQRSRRPRDAHRRRPDENLRNPPSDFERKGELFSASTCGIMGMCAHVICICGGA